ncbi:hypothetical protein FHR95_000434 [Halomonas fontilapidosi]|uniref:Chemotaxis methyl-accepting receptor HlyB-like 4HB MCP domain-containing protein n=1 Tax=Halomonas fontilapidosi TaxID=616675 RepID=A0A7W5DI02_9GAMM|nr:MCP four helix bundle domain-containing protein [Halomonas fontilapidosi]MBB3182910.1 hypothetical protein [Halomonas fontilapidosi]
MARVARLGIRVRLVCGFSAVLALIVVLTVIGIEQVNRIDRNLTTINDVNGVKLRHAIDWRGSVHDRAILLRDMTLVTSEAELERLQADYRVLSDNYQAAVQGMESSLEASAPSQQERRLLAAIDTQAERTNALASDIIASRDIAATLPSRAMSCSAPPAPPSSNGSMISMPSSTIRKQPRPSTRPVLATPLPDFRC